MTPPEPSTQWERIAQVWPALRAALALLPTQMDTPEAAVLLLAIGLQESQLRWRVQISPGAPDARGPARGLLQFEKLGGAAGVLRHSASRYWAHELCRGFGVAPNATGLWGALETNDVLAFAAARLLLFTDPKRLPVMGDASSAWALYLRVWRPGKPHRGAWPGNYAAALAAVSAHANG